MAEYVNIKTDSIDKNVPTKDTFEARLPKSKTVTLTASGWNNNTQTVTVNGVSASEATQLITVSPTKTKVNTYIESGIYCSGQAENSLTFTCSEAPTEDITIYVTIEPVFLFSSILDENSWEDIQLAAELGIGQNYWSVGDTKKIVINGKVSDGLTLTNFETYVFILGFDHNAELEGSGITFGGFKTAQTGGIDICLVDSAYDTIKSSGQWFNMNNTDSNIGGWQSSLMRTVTMPLIKAAFPSDLQAVIKTSTIYTDNMGETPQTIPELTATQDDIFLLAEYEIFGVRSYANSKEPNYLKQYAYYAAGNSKMKYKHNNVAGHAIYWERSPLASTSINFCAISISGGAYNPIATDSEGVAPAFRVGKKIAEITTSLSPTPDATYVEGLSGLEPADISKFANAIMVNDNITNEATSVYIDYDYGKSHRKINVADQVTIPLNGVDYKFDIIGFKHDQWSPQTYTPQESEISVASDTSLSIYKAGITFQMHDCFATIYPMNSSNTNSGGWADSLMRTSTMVTMANYLPTAWQQILKRAFKDYQTLDWCFLLSEMEVFGVNTYASDDTYTNKQYAYYKAGNSKVKNMNDYASHWYERSPQSGSSNEFCMVARDGSAYSTNATLHPGTAFGFCV